MDLRILTLGLASMLGSMAMAQPYSVTVSGHLFPCDPAFVGNTVTVQSVQGTTPFYYENATINANCYYVVTLEMDEPTGWFQVGVNCLDGTSNNNSGQYNWTPADTAVVINLTCGVNEPCNASFSWEQTAPYTISTTNSSTGEGSLSYTWAMPMGETSTDLEPGYVFQDIGQSTAYGLCLTIVDGAGCSSTQCDSIFVDTEGNVTMNVPEPCVPAFSFEQATDPNDVIIPFAVQLTNESTGWGEPTYSWSVSTGGGNMTPISPADLVYQFNAPGTYQLCLTMSGFGCGIGETTCHTITVDADGNISAGPGATDCEGQVGGPALPGTPCDDGNPMTINDTWNADCECVGTPSGICEAGFWVIQAFDSSNGQIEQIPFELWVWNLSTGDGAMQQMWNFGDGNTSYDAYPTHVYAGSGPYELCLTIWDSNGCTDTYCDTIVVDQDGIFNGMMGEGDHRNALTLNVIQSLPTTVDDKPAFDDMAVWPNPASELLSISVGSTIAGNTTVTIIDLNGRIVRTMSRSFNRGTNMITVPVADLADGMYTIRIDNGGNAINHRFVKGQ